MITRKNFHYVFRIAKRTIPFFKKENRFTKILKRKATDEGNKILSELIISGKPFMAARYGSTEARAIVNHKLVQNNYSDIIGIYKYLTGSIGEYWKNSSNYLNNLKTLSGFFSDDDPVYFNKFIKLMDDSAVQLDLLGVWNELEEYITEIPPNISLVKIREMEPWFYENPWSEHLKGKKVLVIHPFEETIIQQYKNNRKNIYLNGKILPEFELKTIKAVQTIAGEKSEYKDWFHALNSMKEKIDQTDFDIAIIGCGAYGFPLAAYVKTIGKQAIHLGGVTQLLFGIKGKRWEDWEHYIKLRGSGWVRAQEVPKDFKKIEDGCYW